MFYSREDIIQILQEQAAPNIEGNTVQYNSERWQKSIPFSLQSYIKDDIVLSCFPGNQTVENEIKKTAIRRYWSGTSNNHKLASYRPELQTSKHRLFYHHQRLYQMIRGTYHRKKTQKTIFFYIFGMVRLMTIGVIVVIYMYVVI